jgi:hypothetical protein
MSATSATILSLVLFVTYIGIGALAHDTRFSLGARSSPVWVAGEIVMFAGKWWLG